MMAKEDKPMVLFKHLRKMQKVRQAPVNCSAERFFLDQVAAYNIQFDNSDAKTSRTVTLHEVPSFLIEAFSKFEQLEGCKVEGVFRKEGNSLRCKEDAMPVFYGAQKISSTFLVHDVCSWIKKFFRELRQPLFGNHETQLLEYAEDLKGDMLFASIASLLYNLPTSHKASLGYLMRCLKQIAETSNLHQMTIENLATVFAPSLFRGCQDKPPKMSKKRNGSQDDLLQTLKRNNDLQVLVVKVLIENADKLGSAKQSHAAAASKPPSGHSTSGSYMKINAAQLKKNSRSSSNLSSEPSTSSLSKQRRSSSVVQMAFKSFKKSLTNLTSEAFASSPDPSGLANKKISKPTTYLHPHHPTPLQKSVSMDPSTTTSSNDTLSDFTARRKQPEYIGVNFQEIRKVMSPKDSPKKRPAFPNFDNRCSSNDEKKENEQDSENSSKKSAILRKCSSSGSKKPLEVSNTTNIQQDATQMNARDHQCIDPEVGPSISHGTVNRRIQQFKSLSNHPSILDVINKCK